jgi:opacity protein-like surface antigen
MKKLILLFVVLMVTSNLIAQTKTSVLLNTGLSIPSSGEYFSEYWSTSYNFGAGIEFQLNPQLSLLGYIDYNNYSFDIQKAKDKLRTTDQGEGGSVTMFILSADVKYFIIDVTHNIMPYLLGGLGYSSVSTSDFTRRRNDGRFRYTISGESIGVFSVNFGLGAQYAVAPNISIFADARYVLGFTDSNILNFTFNDNSNQETIPYTMSDNLSSLPLRVGVLYSF